MTGKAEQKSFEAPDETRAFDYGAMDLLQIGGAEIGGSPCSPDGAGPTTSSPWRDRSVRGAAFPVSRGGNPAHRDGRWREFDARPGDVTALPQGHDAWVVGDEPVVVVDWYGASNYARS